MAIKQLYPTIRPSLNLNFARTKRLDPRIQFTRASIGTYVDSSGIIRTANPNEPRFDHDPATGESLGLLVEEQRTNLLTYSENFNNASWSVSGTASITSNYASSPDGFFTATLLDGAIGTTFPFSFVGFPGSENLLYRNVNAGSGFYTTVTGSIWVKGVTATTVRIGILDPNTLGFYTQSYTISSSWQRIYIVQYVTSQGGRLVICGANGSLLIWGAQLEAAPFPTSYIPTSDSAVTRSADVATIEGANFSSWYNQSEGTLYANLPNGINAVADNRSNYANFGISSGALPDTSSAGNGIKYGTGSPPTATRCFIIADGFFVLDSNSSVNASQISIAYAQNNFAIAREGETLSTGSQGNVPASMNTFTLMPFGSVLYSRLAYYPTRLTDAQLQTLTR